MIYDYDVIIVGCGIAGLISALTAAENCRVAVVSKVYVTRSHSVAAQGGIAACPVMLKEDSRLLDPLLFFADTAMSSIRA